MWNKGSVWVRKHVAPSDEGDQGHHVLENLWTIPMVWKSQGEEQAPGNFMQKSIFKQPSKLHSSRYSAGEMKRKMKVSDHVTIT